MRSALVFACILGICAAATLQKGSPKPMLSQDELDQFKAQKAENSKNCGDNAEWRECGNLCPEKTCSTLLAVSPCFSLRCGMPSCACKPGFVRAAANDASKGCVHVDTCRLSSSQKH